MSTIHENDPAKEDQETVNATETSSLAATIQELQQQEPWQDLQGRGSAESSSSSSGISSNSESSGFDSENDDDEAFAPTLPLENSDDPDDEMAKTTTTTMTHAQPKPFSSFHTRKYQQLEKQGGDDDKESSNTLDNEYDFVKDPTKPKPSLYLQLPSQNGSEQQHQQPQRRPLPTSPLSNSPIVYVSRSRQSHPLPSSRLSNSTVEFLPRSPPRRRKKNRQKRHKRRQRHLQHSGTPFPSGSSSPFPQGQKDQSPLQIPVPTSNWITIENIPPLSSLEAMLQGVEEALDAAWIEAGGTLEEIHQHPRGGFVDLDSTVPDQRLQLDDVLVGLHRREQKEEDHLDGDNHNENHTANTSTAAPEVVSTKWVSKAYLKFSHLGRPNGWYMELANRSVVYALLCHSQAHPLHCSWKEVTIKEYDLPQRPVPNPPNGDRFNITEIDSQSSSLWSLKEDKETEATNTVLPWAPIVTDATVRVEQVPENFRMIDIYRLFSRFDLASPRQLMERGIVPQQPPQPVGEEDTTLTTDEDEDEETMNHNDNDEKSSDNNNNNNNNNHFYQDPIFLWDPPSETLPPRLRLLPTTYLVHFASPAWARAAVREKQGSRVHNGHYILKLAQYPKQLL